MTLADDLKPLAHSVRAIPGQLGIRPYTVSTIKRTWSGGNTGNGTPTDTETPITEADSQPPRVRALSGEEKALLDLAGTAWEIGPITPSFSGGGTAISVLKPTDLYQGDEFFIRLVGPEYPTGALMRIVDIKTDRALNYRVTVKPVEEQKP
jgi:hypothetical protein